MYKYKRRKQSGGNATDMFFGNVDVNELLGGIGNALQGFSNEPALKDIFSQSDTLFNNFQNQAQGAGFEMGNAEQMKPVFDLFSIFSNGMFGNSFQDGGKVSKPQARKLKKRYESFRKGIGENIIDAQTEAKKNQVINQFNMSREAEDADVRSIIPGMGKSPRVMQKGGHPTRQDSLDLYNNTLQVLDYYRKKGYKPVEDETIDEYLDGRTAGLKPLLDDIAKNRGEKPSYDIHAHNRLAREQDELGVFNSGDARYSKIIDGNRYLQRELETFNIDRDAPFQLHDKRINPKRVVTFVTNGDNFDENNAAGVLLYQPPKENIRNIPSGQIDPNLSVDNISLIPKYRDISGRPISEREYAGRLKNADRIETQNTSNILGERERLVNFPVNEIKGSIGNKIEVVKSSSGKPKYFEIDRTSGKRIEIDENKYNLLKEYYAVQQYQTGGQIPVSPQGQFAFPGQPVMVPTQNGMITMDGVNQPLFAMDMMGNSAILPPNSGMYQFGTDMVYEEPIERKRRKSKTSKKVKDDNKGLKTGTPKRTVQRYNKRNARTQSMNKRGNVGLPFGNKIGY